MPRLLAALRAVCFLAPLLGLLAPAPARAAPPSADSIETLMTLTKAARLLESVYADVGNNMRRTALAQRGGRPLSPEEEKGLEAVAQAVSDVLRKDMSWQVMKPQLVKMYQDVLTQEEVDASIAFYRSPAGQAMIEKGPVILQRSMAMTQAQFQTLLPKIKAAAEKAQQDVNANAAKDGKK